VFWLLCQHASMGLPTGEFWGVSASNKSMVFASQPVRTGKQLTVTVYTVFVPPIGNSGISSSQMVRKVSADCQTYSYRNLEAKAFNDQGELQMWLPAETNWQTADQSHKFGEMLCNLLTNPANRFDGYKDALAFAESVIPIHASGRVSDVEVDRLLSRTRPLPTIKMYYPNEYNKFRRGLLDSSLDELSYDKIYNKSLEFGKALASSIIDELNNENTIKEMTFSRDYIDVLISLSPERCSSLINGESTLRNDDMVKISQTLMPLVNSHMNDQEAALKQAAISPVSFQKDKPDPGTLRAIYLRAVSRLPASQQSLVQQALKATEKTPLESEVAGRHSEAQVDVLLEMPPATGAKIFKTLVSYAAPAAPPN